MRLGAVVLGLACALPAIAQSPDPARWAPDVRALLAAIDSIHPDPYRAHDRTAFDRAAARLEARLPALAFGEAVAGLAGILALLEDGHSRMGHVQLSSHTQPTLTALDGPGFATRYPVAFEFFADGLHVVASDASGRAVLGGHVVSLGGRPAEEVGQALTPFLSADNAIWRLYLLPEYLRHPGYLHAAGVLGAPSDPLDVTVRHEDGSIATATLRPGAPTAALPLGARRAPRPLWEQFDGNFGFRYLDDDDVMYVRYRVVQPEDDETVAAFVARLGSAMDTLRVARVVLDVRRNGGGNNYLNQPLIERMLREERLRPPGGIVILTDRGTYSAAISLIGEMERWTWSVFVGEPSGSGVNHFGDPARVTLPVSGLLVRISTLRWQGSDPRDQRPSILPDVLVVPTFAQWRDGADPVLEAALVADVSDIAWLAQPNMNWSRPAQRGAWTTGVRW